MEIRTPAKICSRLGIAVFTLFAVWTGGAVILTFVLYALLPGIVSNSWFIWIVSDVPLYLIALPFFLLILRTIPEGPAEARPRASFSLPKFLLLLAFCFGATYLISYLTELVMTAANFWKPELLPGDAVDSILTQSGPLQNLIFVVCIPAFGEEFIFRYLFRRKLRGSGDKIYILFSALCFAMFHANFAQIFYAFALGAIFAWIYTRTNNIFIPISIHFCINLAGIYLPELMESGIGTLIITIVIWALIIASLILFFTFLPRVRQALFPPSEPGWPYRPYKKLYSPTADTQAEYARNHPFPPFAQQADVYRAYPLRQPQAPSYPQAAPVNTYPPVPGYFYPPPPPAYPGGPSHPPQGGWPPAYFQHSAQQPSPPGYAYPPYAPPAQYTHTAPTGAYGWPTSQPTAWPPPPYPYGPAANPPAGYWAPFGYPAAPPPPHLFQAVPTPAPAHYSGYYGPEYNDWYNPKPKGAPALCLGNPGMILFLIFTGIFALITLFAY